MHNLSILIVAKLTREVNVFGFARKSINMSVSNGNHKSKRQRSPDYPQYTLRDCVAFLSNFIKRNGVAEAHRNNAVNFMGHSPTSSTADRVIAAMNHYGFFESRGSGDDRFFTPSELAKSVYATRDNSVKHLQLLQEAALTPEAMKMAVEKWGQFLPSREAVQTSLLVELGFSRLGADKFSGILVDNYEFAKIASNTDTFEEPEKPKEHFSSVDREIVEKEVKMNNSDGYKEPEKPEKPSGNLKDFRIPLFDKPDAFLFVPDGLNESDYDFMIDFISLIKKRIARKEQSYDQKEA